MSKSACCLSLLHCTPSTTDKVYNQCVSVPAGFLEKLSVCCIFDDYFLVVLVQLPSMLHLYISTGKICAASALLANLLKLACKTYGSSSATFDRFVTQVVRYPASV